jgi:hypothetical protein
MQSMIGAADMNEQLEAIEKQVGKRNFDSPPLHLWDPPLSGDIAIRIASDGDWYHEGGKIARASIVRLFAALLRREDDGDYYLVTPVEKWRIQVDAHPLVVIDAREEADLLVLTLNTGREVTVGEHHPLFLDPVTGGVAAVRLDHGLTAIFSRAAWVRLVEQYSAGDGVPEVRSGAYRFALDG